MRKITVFNSVSLDGYFTGENGDLTWARQPRDDKERGEFVSRNAGGEGTLLFGRVTYEMMASYWPTPMAEQSDREVRLIESRTFGNGNSLHTYQPVVTTGEHR
jgi:dihydrofolate reductase